MELTVVDVLNNPTIKDWAAVIDRKVSAGVMFSDADLMGIPVRIIASPRNMKEGCCEVVTRDKSVREKVALEDVFATVQKMVQEALAR